VDLNHLLFQHQVAVLHATGRDDAPDCASRAPNSTHDLVRHYKARIDRLREQLGVTIYPDWCGIPVGDAA
jgi:ribosome-binding protein aMBF1 (putative translation factor)